MHFNTTTHPIFIVISVVMLQTNMLAQQERPTDSLGPRVTTSGAKYTDDSSHEFNANFEVNYRVNSNLFFQIRGYRNKYIAQDVFGGSFFAKQYVTKRFYLYSGVSAEFMGGVFPNASSTSVKLSQFNMANGMGYDLNKNFTIEVENLINLKQNFGGFSNQNDFSVRGKFKF